MENIEEIKAARKKWLQETLPSKPEREIDVMVESDFYAIQWYKLQIQKEGVDDSMSLQELEDKSFKI